jgi:putative ABC transport system permease protein
MKFWFDLKYASRLLKKSWGYSLMCASVVALSVGLALWTYALAYSLLWRPLPFPDSARWYSVQISPSAGDSGARPSFDAYTYQRLLANSRSTHHLGAFSSRMAVLSEGEATTSLRTGAISPGLLAATGVVPHLGRTFQETDGQPGAAAVAVLSYDTWQSYFAADPSIIGKTARLDAAPVQIVGVMPKGFYAFQDFELWVPLHLPVLARPSDSTSKVTPFVALGPDQTASSVLNEMKPAVEQINREYPSLYKPTRHPELIPAPLMYTHSDSPLVGMLGLMSAAVLLLGCVNISMVFLSRLLERSRELALRTALGASRSRLLRQCLLETALVILPGLVAGYGLAAVGVRWARGVSTFMAQIEASGRPPYLPEFRASDFLVAVVFAVVIWLLSTLIPAWRIAKQDAAVVLAGSGKGASIRGSNKSVGLLVGLQVVFSCLVLVVCANVVTAVEQEVNKPTGLSTSQVILSTAPTVFDERYAEPARRVHYWEDLTAAIQSRIPGAQVAFATAPPARPAKVQASIESRQGADNQGTLTIPVAVVSESYFNLLGLTVRSGRLFDSTDNGDSLKVAVVDEQMVARYWPDQDVLGKRVQLSSADNGPWLTIVGVVSAVAGRPYYGEDVGVLYQPLRQAVPESFQLLVKLPNAPAGDPRTALRAAAFAVDRDLPLHNLQTLDDFLAALWMDYGALVPVMIAVALITALLAASGLFGLISRSVAQRTQEVGIRRALGATSWRATSMFMRQGAIYLSVAIVSVVLGILVMPALSAVITNIFAHVLLATLAVVLLIAAVIFAASYLPTRRAVALEPGDALRYE